MSVGLLVTAFAFGLRHGVDWDHLAAIVDLSGTAETRRRGVWLSFLYALAHAAVVLVLGSLAIAFGTSIPDGVDAWMGRVVGATLIALGLWILVELVRRGRDFRLRSRWLLILGGTFAGLRRVRAQRSRRRVSVHHDHPHPHGSGPHDSVQAHDHAHLPDEPIGAAEPLALSSPSGAGTPSRDLRPRPSGESGNHRHHHRHDLELPTEAGRGIGARSAAGIGVLHGVGVESPTQIAVFVASTSVAGTGAGLALLVGWIVGLLAANTVLAVLVALGLLQAERNFGVYATVALVVAVLSVVMGLFLVAGLDGWPEIPI